MGNLKSNQPDPLASFEEKKSDEYGLQVAKMISNQWFNGGVITNSSDCTFMNRRNYVREKRKFVRGESDDEYFKNQFSKGDADLKFINLDWSEVNFAEKFARIVSNGISDENYKLDIRATDRISAMNRKKKEDYYKSYILSKQMLESIKEELGIDLTPDSFIPEDEEEMQLYMEMKERPKIEIAEEVLIDFVKETNGWDFIEGQKNKDLVDVGLIIARVWIDKNDGVKVAYVDPENYIHSRVSKNNFEDKYYEGVVETVTLSELRRESGFNDSTLREIAKTYASTSGKSASINYDKCDMDDLLDVKVDILRFAYKTSKTIKYKAKVRKDEIVKVSRKDDTFIAPDRKDVSELSNIFDTWFEGNYVIGTDYIYEYRECENLYDDVMNKAQSPFITMAYDIYDNKLRSFVGNIEVPARQLQKIHLKIQHLVNELKPDIIEIDLDMLADLEAEGKGGKKQQVWETALSLLNMKGVVFKKRIDMGDEGGVKETSAVRQSSAQQGSQLPVLLNTWAHYYNLIRENTGVNPARDGSLPADALVGVNQMAQLASNTVTRNILETSVAFNKKVSEVISSRIHSIFYYKEAKKLKELYTNVVSKHLIDSIEVMKGRHLHEFGFTFRMMPTNEELKDFNETLMLALQEGSIDAEIKIEAQRIAKSNIKLATQYLMYHRRKRIKQRQQEQMMLTEHKSKHDAMAAQSAEQAKAKGYQFKKQVDLDFKQREAMIDVFKEQALQEIRRPVEERKFDQDVFIAKIKEFGSLSKEAFKEDRKDDRTKIQASQQSKMIEQRNNNESAIDFESPFSDLMR